jgi:hypothetical protein
MDIITDSVANWPHKGIATSGTPDDEGVIIPATVCVFTYVLTGTIIHITGFAPGYYDVGHTEGQICILKPTTYHNDSLIKAIEDKSSLPAGGTTGQVLAKKTNTDADVQWQNIGSVSQVVKEAVTGTVNGTNKTFTTLQPYVGGSLQVYINGIAQSGFISETNPGTGVFDTDIAPSTGADIRVAYHTATSATWNADTLDGYHLGGLLEAIYPIGAVYLSGSSSMPAIVASVGTWVRLKGVTIVGVDEAKTEFDTVNKTGGATTHTLTTAQIPNAQGQIVAHSSRSSFWQPSGVFGGSSLAGTYSPPSAATGGATSIFELKFNNGGQDQPHNNLQPYKTKFMWERTA